MSRRVDNGSNGLPIVNGTEIISTRNLPDRVRSVFKYEHLTFVQSKCFPIVYNSSDNFVLSAPTGSGKTTIVELAICRLLVQSQPHEFKIIYQAPTKALCSEKQKDWSTRFRQLDVNVVELTGDTEIHQLKSISNADIIVTTPEKWDSMTRKWKDHKKFMDLVKLFLIDEVHILKEERGASLEAVVSRMKNVGTDVRFVALSATVPNSDDIAVWLGRNSRSPDQPARLEVFGEEHRPIQLEKFVIPIKGPQNDFPFDKTCTSSLPNVIAEYGKERKPLMIFCFTRKSCEETAATLSEWWASSRSNSRYWDGPKKQVQVQDKVLNRYVSTGVAFHHAGIANHDRLSIERAYLDGDVNVICCTSTLAVGVNLPCHMVIIKNTVVYEQAGCKEYSDLEIMQMLGRAGRPGFDRSALGVIMTRPEKVRHYESMVSGQEILESKLHLNLIEHMNAEIGLGTISDQESARAWLQGTFFYVRLCKNMHYYTKTAKLPGHNPDDIVNNLCEETLKLLHKYALIAGAGSRNFKSTEYGDAMARYYVQFPTMQLIMDLQKKAKISEILSVLAQAAEFQQIRFRSSERSMFKDMNDSSSIKFPIKVNLDQTAHKVSLLIQAVLGGLDLRNDDRFKGASSQLYSDISAIFLHSIRLIRCIIDCQIHQSDSIGTRNALELSRSLGAKAWDDTPLQLAQIAKIGPVAVRKLVNAGVRTIDDLENTEPHQIDHILSKNPPFGLTILSDLRTFPKLRVGLRMMGQPKTTMTEKGRRVRIHLRADIGFINESPPTQYGKKPVYVCMLAETSDGQLVHFCRMSAQKIGTGFEVQFQADLSSPQQLVNCSVSCDDFVGTHKMATLKPAIASGLFPKNAEPEDDRPFLAQIEPCQSEKSILKAETVEDEFDDNIDDADLAAAEMNDDFEDIDDERNPAQNDKPSLAGAGKLRKPSKTGSKVGSAAREAAHTEETEWQPERLPNGNWKCLHRCTNRMSCKHPCCRDGTENKPKKKQKKAKQDGEEVNTSKTTKSAKSNTSKSSKGAGPAHKDPFTASKKSIPSAGSLVQKNNTNLSETTKRPRSQESEFGGADLFDGIDEEVSEAVYKQKLPLQDNDAFKPRFSAPSHGLFVTSSPNKAPAYEELDLSSELPELHNTGGGQDVNKHGLDFANHGQSRKKPRLAQNEQAGKLTTMRDLDKVCSVAPLQQQSSIVRRSSHDHAYVSGAAEQDLPASSYELSNSIRLPSRDRNFKSEIDLQDQAGLSGDDDLDMDIDMSGAPIVQAAFTASGIGNLLNMSDHGYDLDGQDDHNPASPDFDEDDNIPTVHDIGEDYSPEYELDELVDGIDEELETPLSATLTKYQAHDTLGAVDGELEIDEGYDTMQSMPGPPSTITIDTQAARADRDDEHISKQNKTDTDIDAEAEADAWVRREYGDYVNFL